MNNNDYSDDIDAYIINGRYIPKKELVIPYEIAKKVVDNCHEKARLLDEAQNEISKAHLALDELGVRKHSLYSSYFLLSLEGRIRQLLPRKEK